MATLQKCLRPRSRVYVSPLYWAACSLLQSLDACIYFRLHHPLVPPSVTVSYTSFPLLSFFSLSHSLSKHLQSVLYVISDQYFYPSIDLFLPLTIISQLLLSSLSTCSTLYNRLNCFAVCHFTELPWGFLVTRLHSFSLSCTAQQSEAQAVSVSFAPYGGYCPRS